jgi:asparagine synthase (glutamine-hydrolysing)
VNCIFGLFYRDGRHVDAESMAAMSLALPRAGEKPVAVWRDGTIGLGQEFYRPKVECQQPFALDRDADTGAIIAWAGRIDNRNSLCESLDIPFGHRSQIPDSGIVLAAYRKWGEDAARQIIGDWTFAIWLPRERTLFVARDHHGNSAMYYHEDARVFAFASNRKPLLALKLAPREVDELRLAEFLLALPASDATRTLEKNIRFLPPAHTLAVTADSQQMRRYWYLEHAPEIRLARREEYVEALRELFDEAVRCRLPLDGKVGVTLSGGLDSGSVTAIAAEFLHREGKRLPAFVSVPVYDTTPFCPGQSFGDELPFAQLTAKHVGNVDIFAISAADVGIIQSLQEALQLYDEPPPAAANMYWISAILRSAKAQGCDTLLTGQQGNGGISWTGYISSQPWRVQLRQLGLIRYVKHMVKGLLPRKGVQIFRRIQSKSFAGGSDGWKEATVINPDFARRVGLYQAYDSWPHPFGEFATPRDHRHWILQPGRTSLGATWADVAISWAMNIWDPTADIRLLEFVLGVPDELFLDPNSGMNRWLIRATMEKRLAPEVRLNDARGRQAGDLVMRLRKECNQVELLLNEIALSRAADFVAIPQMTKAWRLIKKEYSFDAYRKANQIFSRGIIASLFVNQF